MKKHVEVEGGELAIRNKKGDVVIIPKGNKKWVAQKLKEKCYECIDKFVSTLPKSTPKAQDGGVYPPGNEPTYIGSDLPEVTVTAKAPGWYKNVRQYAKDNPFDINTYVQERMQNPRGRERIDAIDPKRFEKQLRQEGLAKRQQELQEQASAYIGSKKPKGMSRAEWLNTLTTREEQLVKTDPKYQTSLWQDAKRGLQSLGEVTPVQAAANISKDKGYSAREKQELIQGYAQQPGLSAMSDAAKLLSPLAIPAKVVQSTYRKESGPMEALAGKKNKASLFEDIATDPLTYTGMGLLGKGSKVGKGAVGTKLNQAVDVGQASKKGKVLTDKLPPPPQEQNWFGHDPRERAWRKYEKDLMQEYRLFEEMLSQELRGQRSVPRREAYQDMVNRVSSYGGLDIREILRREETLRQKLRNQGSVPSESGQVGNTSPMNLSDFTREEVLARASARDKEIISKMSDAEFSKTKLKPTGEVVYYDTNFDPSTKLTGKNKVTSMSHQAYVERFNENIDVLNKIIAKNNKSGVEYKAVSLDDNGRLTFYTPEQEVMYSKKLTPADLLSIESFDHNPIMWATTHLDLRLGPTHGTYQLPNGTRFNSRKEVIEYAEKEILRKMSAVQTAKIPEGQTSWNTGIQAGEWKGIVEDIPNERYYRAIPGLEMRNTSSGVFSDRVPRRGTGTYKSINEYLKELGLGRVKPGFNSQTQYSRGVWEDAIKSGKAVGYYDDQFTIYGTMKNMFPYLGLGYAGYAGTKKTKKQKPE